MTGQIRNGIAALALTALWGAGAGCASTQVRTDQDPHTNLARYRTFQLKSGSVVNGGVTDARDLVVRDHVDAALQQSLEEKGLTPARGNPDLIATYTARAHAVIFMEPDSSPIIAYPDSVYDREGTLVIDLIDPRSQKLVWRSMTDVRAGKMSPEHIGKVVDQALEKFPTKAIVAD